MKRVALVIDDSEYQFRFVHMALNLFANKILCVIVLTKEESNDIQYYDSILPQDLSKHVTSKLSLQRTVEFISSTSPELILVVCEKPLFYPPICLDKTIISSFPGITPYYNSSNPVISAVMRADIKNVGATIYKVDGNNKLFSVIEYAYPQILPNDSLKTIIDKVQRIRMQKLLDVGERCLNGQLIKTYPFPSNFALLNIDIPGNNSLKQACKNIKRKVIKQFYERCDKGQSIEPPVFSRARIFVRKFMRTKLKDDLPNAVYVVVYHTISNFDKGNLLDIKCATSYKRFFDHLSLFRDNFSVVSLNEAISVLKKYDGNIPGKYLAITFDDAYKSVYECAIPLLNDFRFPATIFINDGPTSGNKGTWRVRLAYLLERRGIDAVNTLNKILGVKCKTSEELFNFTKNNYSRKVVDSIDSAWHTFNMGSIDLDDFMTYNDLLNLDGNQYEFGSHTINHPILSHLPEEEAEKEILNGHKAVETRLKRKINYFAYPFGNYKHWSYQNELALLHIPYVNALTANGGINHYYYPFHIRRIGLLNERKDDLRRIFMKQAALIV